MRTDEIFSLTVGLKLLSRGTMFQESLGGIADLIYKQLSPSAREVIDWHSEPNGISYADSEMHFINSEEYIKKESLGKLPYYLKQPGLRRVLYDDDGTTKHVIGSLHFYNQGPDRWQKVVVKNEEEEIVIGIENIMEIN